MTIDLSNKTILLTGGTGSFGSAFVAHVRERWPSATIRVFSRDELKQLQMCERFGEEGLRFFIGDVRDGARLRRAAHGADYLIHAAAMKQVPACEYNPFEAVQTNVNGAANVVDAAIDAGVKRVVALSTDKAVNPVNLYGATKLCAEKIVVHGSSYAAASGPTMCCVRYGNVVGSRGSVVPLFKRQALEGQLTITDERMTRFWITLEEAVKLVLYALENAVGGEVFVPKIPSMRVVDLARALAPDAETKITGIRPGEKIHELLITSDESRNTRDAGDVYVVLPTFMDVGGSRWANAPSLPEGFSFGSDTNDWWLTDDELREMLV